MKQFKNNIFFSLLLIFTIICSKKSFGDAKQAIESILATDENNLQFSCTYEVDSLPSFTSESETIFKEMRALQIEHQYSSKADETLVAGYRKAAKLGHVKAMINLQNMLVDGLGTPNAGMTHSEEALYWVEQLIKLDIGSGYYQMGYFLSTGFMVEQDEIKGLKFYRRAADLGNKEAQAMLGDIFSSLRLITYDLQGIQNPAYRPEIGKSMLECAAVQGHQEAAGRLGYLYSEDKNYDESIKAYQIGARHGDEASIRALIYGFSITDPKDAFYLGQDTIDVERLNRYKSIKNKLNSDANFKFPDINKIVPLPPNELPKWDGTFEYDKTL
ncbi:SEL1-like repeat protein [Thorsellia kenyensis]|uniref:DUF6396 domain-containing protein n=1 Tax=Thorsellia kenyensis TaxID=1549888 RepID=A0ABV6CAD1_9GAMM